MKKLLVVLVLGMTLLSCSKEEVEPNLIDTLIGKTYLYSEYSGELFEKDSWVTTILQMQNEDCFTASNYNDLPFEFTLNKSTPNDYWFTMVGGSIPQGGLLIKYIKRIDDNLDAINIMDGIEYTGILYREFVVICD